MSTYERPQNKRRIGDHDDKEPCAVRVEKLPVNVDCKEIVALFKALIGDISSVSDVKDVAGHHLDIVFSNRDACKKALCMSGYNVSGHSLRVVLAGEAIPPLKRQDNRRNLYVLGLPFDLSKIELTSFFSQYGTVSHCVILATVDSASRRRGFVVMSCHEEARHVMASLTRTQIRGHTIDISWAIVQRSQGFLDGGDRAVLFDAHSHPPRLPSPNASLEDNIFSLNISPNSSFGSSQSDSSTLLLSTLPTNTILITELPSLLFSQFCDLNPLLDPFGKIDKLEILDSPSVTPGTISVKVEYASIANAREALESLQGQCYVNFTLRVQYLQIALPNFCATPGEMNFPPHDYSAMYFDPHSRYPSPYRPSYVDYSPMPRHGYAFAPPSARSFRPQSRSSSANAKWCDDGTRVRYPLSPYSSNVALPSAVPYYRAF